ncbi:MAG: SWIM zinc finger family protein [Methanomicrobiales archaeon]|nr:SWIM zinc finger family protein [Methanomicrobiales archaeon]
MSSKPEQDGQEIWDALERDHALSIDLQERILRVYGERGRKAILAVDESRIKKYLDFFVVVGTSDEYVVEDEFCACRAQVYRGGSCWHVLAAKIAHLTGQYEVVDEWYMETLK